MFFGCPAWPRCNEKAVAYQLYLEEEHWQQVRKEALERAAYRCSKCNLQGGILDVHHLNYEHMWCERSEDVVVVCRNCHGATHEQAKGDSYEGDTMSMLRRRRRR